MISNYFVIAARPVVSKYEIVRVISCDFNDITQFVKNLNVQDEVTLLFFPIEDLQRVGNMTTQSNHVEKVDFNAYKSFNDFEDELDKMLTKLKIKNEVKK